MKRGSGGPRQGARLFLPSVLGTGGASGRVGAERAHSSGGGWAGGCQMHAVGRKLGSCSWIVGSWELRETEESELTGRLLTLSVCVTSVSRVRWKR